MLKGKFSCEEYFSFLFYRNSQHSPVKGPRTLANIDNKERVRSQTFRIILKYGGNLEFVFSKLL